MDRLQQELEEFTRDVIPADCSETQRTEMRRSFMGGASAMLAIMCEISEQPLGEGPVSIDGLMKEIEVFSLKVMAGLA